ncbi:YtxH domain-containing protein [Pseudomonas schmalbachii]|uniref:YtxH domain-containing protein n=1 Tax=Pseudomonas schmalbachii TaxID=2816993 RepID=A0ABS3TJT6_9PSED|nr:YtxH domain-containing protein [Pseudomonas schmalbachii]MBO3273916.1 YtxH domain-containing protein [Pseudomonas schmalbachii]
MAKKGKKHRQAGGYDQGNGYGTGYGGYGYVPQNQGAWQAPPQMMGGAPGAGWQDPAAMFGMAGGMDAGILQGLPTFLRSRNTEQFLLGLLVGTAATWVLTDEELRGKLLKSAVKLYANLAGGLEEFKEQMADVKAEFGAQQRGDE